MPKAARVGDSCVHPGSKLATGSPDTIVEGMKQSRLTDVSLGCTVPIPTPPHAVGHLSKCSLTVFVNKLGAARVGDLLICPSPPAGPGPPGGPGATVNGYTVSDADNFVGKMYHNGRTGDVDKDGTKDTAEGKAGVYTLSKGNDNYKVTVDVLSVEGKASANLGTISAQAGAEGRVDGLRGTAEAKTESYGGWRAAGDGTVGHAEAKGRAGASLLGAGVQGEAQASVARGHVEGSFGGTKTNPFKAEAKAEGKVLTADAKADALVGYDGKRVGLYGALGATAKTLDGEVGGGLTIPIPWTGLDFQIGAKTGGSVGSVGAAGGGGVYYDTESKRAVGNIFGELALLFGLKFDLEISFGKRAAAPVAGGGPDSVASGASNVYIGG